MSIQSLAKYAGSALVLCALQAGAVDLSPTVDTYVHSGSPTLSYGTKTVLEAKTASTSSRDSYLKFDLSAQSSISKVELKVYAKYNTTGSVTCGVHGVANTSWTDAMSWNTKAALGSQLATATATNTAAWIVFDVTSYALAEYNAGRRVIALGLHTVETTSSHVTFNSRENSANKPLLVVTTSGGGGGGTTPQAGAMEYYDGSKWVTLPIGKPGQVLSVTNGKIPQWTQIPGTVADIDGNIYKTVIIGNQEWTAENIRTTHYRNADAIPQVTSNASWSGLSSGAYCYYNNTTNAAFRIKHGALYNWYAVTDGRGLAPEGWRVASDADWQVLEDYLQTNGYSSDEGATGKDVAKSMASQTDWIYDPTYGNENTIIGDWLKNNRSGFSAVAGGYRQTSGEFQSQFLRAYWWSTNAYDTQNAYYQSINCEFPYPTRNKTAKTYGHSVRLVRDVQ